MIPVTRSNSVTGGGRRHKCEREPHSLARRSITMIARMPEESMNDTSSRSISELAAIERGDRLLEPIQQLAAGRAVELPG